MNFKINIVNFTLKTFAIFFDYLEIKVIIVHWLSFSNILLVLQDISEQFILSWNEMIEKRFKGITNSQLSVGDRFDKF